MAHGFLSYQDPRGEVDYLDKIYKAIKGYLDKRDKREEKAERKGGLVKSPDPFDDGGPVEPAEIAVDSPKRPPANPLKRALAGSALRRALPSAAATPTEVRGGALARSMGFAGNRVKPEGFVADQIIDVTAVPVNDSAEIVAAIDRLTFVSMNLLSAQKEQNAIAQRQQLFFEKLARKDKAASEERALERAKDFSSNLAYKKSALQSGGGTKLLPGAGGTGGGFAGSFLDTAQTAIKAAPQATKAARSARSAISAGIKGADVGGAIVKSGTTAGKFAPDAAKLAQGASKMLKIPADSLGKLFGGVVRQSGAGSAMALLDTLKAQSAAGALGKGGFFSQLKNFVTGPDYSVFTSDFDGGDDILRKLLGEPGAMQADAFAKMTENSSAIVKSGNLIDVPLNSSAADDLARGISAADAQALAAARMAAGDSAGIKAAEMATDAIVKKGTQQGLKKGSALAKMMVKQFGAAGTKSILKKIPVVAGVAGILFGIQRAMEGDFLGAGLEITSGLLGATGVGAPLGLGIDGFLLARDLGMMPMAKGGILTSATPVVAGEAGAEGFFPLEGARGKKTFAMFGDGIIDAQKKRKKEVAQIQAEGFKLFSEDAQYMKVFDLFNPFKWGRNPENPEQPNNGDGRAAWDPLGLFTGNNNGTNSRSPLVGPPPPVTGTGDLFDVIASGEGGYESINRGVAGDTPGGAESVFGKKLSDMTVGEVMELQAQDKLFAVGKYQIIPKTMKGFVRTMKISLDDKFDSTTQEKFKRYVTDFKRPAVGRYLRGESNNRAEAAQELAREFASIGLAYDEAGRVRGESRYSGTAGNAASISPAEIEAALDRGRNGIDPLGPRSMLPGVLETGNPLSIASQQVANAGLATQTPTIINNYYGGGSQTGGNMPADIAFGVSSGDMGNSWASELRLRTV